MRTRKLKPIFRGLTIAAVGDLRRKNGSDQWTDANITRWITLREGRFVRLDPHAAASLSTEVTHVICSEEEFKRMGLVVKRALKRGRACQIVTLDWLEDSIHAGKGKRLREDEYSYRRMLERERRKERMRLELVKGEENGVKGVNTNLYRLYYDHTHFQYEVVMTRDDEEAGIQGEKYVLSIFESYNAKPHLYWFVVEFYKKKGDKPKIYRPSDGPGVFAQEFALFESFFQIKAGIPWAQRLVMVGKTEKSFFQYQPPTGGKPVGWAPAEFIPAEVPDIVMTDGGVNTLTAAQPATTAADTQDNKSGTSNVAPTTTKPSNAPAPPREQAQRLTTPLPWPRTDLAIRSPPTQDRAQQHGCSASASSPVAPPKVSWATPPKELECTDEAAFALLRDTADRMAWNTTTVG